MRPEYLVRIEGQVNLFWILETSLLPRFDAELRAFNGKSETKERDALQRARTRAASPPKQPKQTERKEPSSSHPPAPAESKYEIGELPPFLPMSAPTFKWGTRDAVDFISDVNWAYETTTKWRKNVFKLPSGQSGKQFTNTLTRLYDAYGSRSPIESVAFKAAAILAPLMLQQPSGKPTYRDNVNHLTRRLKLWEEGNVRDLITEGETIQQQLKKCKKSVDDTTLAKRFATMVFNNNFKGAMSLVTEKGRGGVLPLNAATKMEMSSEHPMPEPINPQALISGEMPPSLHPVFFAPIDGELIKKNALRTGGAGVSQQEDALWHKMISGHKGASAGLANALASVARRLVTEFVDPKGLEALLANRGIAIDKCPGLRPVGMLL
jgi:hypothetical protein